MSKGQKIKELREKYKMTQEQLATKLGISKQTVFKYETGLITNIPSDKIETMAKIFHVSPAYIMDWDKCIEYSLSVVEQSLIDSFRRLNEEGQAKTSEYICDLVSSGRYIKSDLIDFVKCSPTIEQIGVIHDSSKCSDEFISVLAAHHDGEWTDEELDEVREIKEYAKMKNKK